MESWEAKGLPETETNSKFAPENGWLEYEFPFWDLAYFQGRWLLVSGKVLTIGFP